MDKRARAGYMMTLEEAMKFWERCIEAEKALGAPLTRQEKETLLQSMQLGTEISLEDLIDTMKNKKVLMIHEKGNKDESI